MMSDNINTKEDYVVVEYIAYMSARQLYKIADCDGTIYGEDLCLAALENHNTFATLLGTPDNEISARSHLARTRTIIYKNRNIYVIRFRAVVIITASWENPAPLRPNEYRRPSVGSMTLVSTNLPHSISKEQWQKR